MWSGLTGNIDLRCESACLLLRLRGLLMIWYLLSSLEQTGSNFINVSITMALHCVSILTHLCVFCSGTNSWMIPWRWRRPPRASRVTHDSASSVTAPKASFSWPTKRRDRQQPCSPACRSPGGATVWYRSNKLQCLPNSRVTFVEMTFFNWTPG